MEPYDGPHGPVFGFTVSLMLLLLTLVARTTFVTGGAHLKESPTLPELPTLTELKLMVTGLVVHITLGEELEALATE